MNSSVYIFGNFSSGYTQFPDEEFSSSIFQKFYTKAKATTQIAIRRDGNLMYYGYIRKLEAGQYIGLCVLLNSAMLTKFENLFSLFENVIADLAAKGHLIKYNDNGNLISNASHLYLNREEVDLVSASLIAGFSSMQSSAAKLPPVNYAISSESVKEFAVGDDSSEILKSTYTNGYTYIYKSKGFNTAQMNSYQGVLSRISKENSSLKAENNSLKEENSKIRKQKKQFLYVILLCIAAIGCGIGIFLLNDTLTFTRGQLEEANDSIASKDNQITQKNQRISNLNSQINSLQSSLSNEKDKRERAENELNNLKESFSSAIPILITNMEIGNTYNDGSIETSYGSSIYSSNSMYLQPKITYTGIRTGENITLYAKLYGISGTLQTGTSSPSGYTFSSSMTVSSGSGNTYVLSGWGGSNKGFWSRGSYRYEIWYGNVCLRAKTFSVY